MRPRSQHFGRATALVAMAIGFALVAPAWGVAAPRILTEGDLGALVGGGVGAAVEGGATVEDLTLAPGQATVTLAVPGHDPVEVVLKPLDAEVAAYRRTRSFNVSHRGALDGTAAADKPRLAALDGLADRLAAADPGGWSLPPIPAAMLQPKAGAGASSTGDPTGSPAPWTGRDGGGGRSGLDSIATGNPELAARNRPHLLFGFGLLALALLWLPWALWLAWRRIGELGRGWRLAILVAVAAAAALRLVVAPPQVVTMYMGYLLTAKATLMQEVFRYGVGGQVLWNALFQVVPPDHDHVIALHGALASASLLWLAAVLTRAGFRPLGVLLSVTLVGALPMMVWADASDSLTVPVLFWTLGAVVMAQRFCEGHSARADRAPLSSPSGTPHPRPMKPSRVGNSAGGVQGGLAPQHRPSVAGSLLGFWGALIWLAMAAHTRPEHVLFSPLILLGIVIAQADGERLVDRLRLPAWAWLAGPAGYVTLVAPELIHAFQMRSWMVEQGGWPHYFGDIIPKVPELFFSRNALIDPQLTPPALLPLAAASLLIARSVAAWAFRVVLFALGVAWMSFYYIDLSIASLPRLHVTLLLPCAVLVADLCSDLWAWRPTFVRPLGPALALGALAAVGVGAPPNVVWLWQDTNEQIEDRFFRSILSDLPDDEPFVLVRYGNGDPEPGNWTHEHLPDYLVWPPARQGRTLSIRQYFQLQAMMDRPVYFYQGMRCYSRFRQEQEPAPERYFSPACQRMHDETGLTEVTALDAPNRGDTTLRYYDRAPTHRLALFRVEAKAAQATDEPTD